MKSITVEFSNDQSEVLEHISKLCKKETSDFIREALVCLLPLNEYIEVKRNLVVLQNRDCHNDDQKAIKNIEKKIHDINASTGERLKRLGIL